jgi:hypothetical protein
MSETTNQIKYSNMEPRIDPVLSIRLSFGFHSIFGGKRSVFDIQNQCDSVYQSFFGVDSTIFGCNAYHILIYALWLFNIAMENGPVIDGFLKMLIFHGYVSHKQMVHILSYIDLPLSQALQTLRRKWRPALGLGFFQ